MAIQKELLDKFPHIFDKEIEDSDYFLTITEGKKTCFYVSVDIFKINYLARYGMTSLIKYLQIYLNRNYNNIYQVKEM